MKKYLFLLILALSFTLTSCQSASDNTGYAVAPPAAATEDATETAVVEDEVETVVDEESTSTVTSSNITHTIEIDWDDPDLLVIGEQMFLTQINDMYYNFSDYEDKTIVVEGMYSTLYSWDGTSTCAAVYRLGPGCCGNDGWGGFLLVLDLEEYPREDAWVQVVGTPELVISETGYADLYLNVISIEVMTERGAEFVLQ